MTRHSFLRNPVGAAPVPEGVYVIGWASLLIGAAVLADGIAWVTMCPTYAHYTFRLIEMTVGAFIFGFWVFALAVLNEP